jgi:hypothetical protein
MIFTLTIKIKNADAYGINFSVLFLRHNKF